MTVNKYKKMRVRWIYPVNFADINEIMAKAHEQGRDFLFEYEVYSLLSFSGAETVPKSILVKRNDRISDDDLQCLPGEKIVIKIVSPTIMHKTEVHGVQIVDRQTGQDSLCNQTDAL